MQCFRAIPLCVSAHISYACKASCFQGAFVFYRKAGIVNKNDLITAYAELRNKNKEEAKKDVDAVMQVITEALAKGMPVQITGYFKLERYFKKATKFRQPNTGELEDSIPKFTLRFKVGKKLNEIINQNERK